jgi:hypothetical protein
MDSLTAFKVAFITRCAEEGLDIDQIHERVKTALAKAQVDYLDKQAGGSDAPKIPHMPGLGATAGWLMGDGGLFSTLTGAGAGALAPYYPAMLAAGGTALAGGGLLAGKALAESGDDPMADEEAKAQELVSEYKRLGDRARMAAKKKQLRQNRGF